MCLHQTNQNIKPHPAIISKACLVSVCQKNMMTQVWQQLKVK